MNNVKELYSLWREKATADEDLIKELQGIENNESEIEDRFYQSLTFGTAGLRGVIGAGTNRMNVYTVGGATQGLAEFLLSEYENPAVAIAYDSRIKSDIFSKYAAGVLAANGIKVYIYKELMPTPMLSFAVRKLKCKGGIILTASHNPSEYNGYKCYDPEGYQMTDEAAEKTYEFIKKINVFSDIKSMSFEEGIEKGIIEYIGDEVIEEFYEKVENCCLSKEECKNSGLKVIYTPLNGTGNKPVRRVLSDLGIKDVSIVKEQENPDGCFPTCPYPNPEIRQVFELALDMAKENGADLLLATDPDCDRVGIAVKAGEDYKLMSGNEVAVMLSDYLLKRKKELGILPEKPVLVKSFVTTSLVDAIAKKYGAEVKALLTGFKYIGEYITALEAKGEEDRFILGMEESYGYLSGIHARDKDAVVASALICEMAAYYKSKGKSLYEVMSEIYEEEGMYLSALDNYAFNGSSGMVKMGEIMDSLRKAPPEAIGGLKVLKITDYKKSEETGLPSSNVISFELENSSSVIVRPSGTEPKIKIYFTACGKDKAAAEEIKDKLSSDMKKYVE